MKIDWMFLVLAGLGILLLWRGAPAFSKGGPVVDWGSAGADPAAESPRNSASSPHVIYEEAIRRTAEMVSDSEAQQLASKHGLNILNVTWEDTGRYKNSAVGPNISDMTIQVGFRNPESDQFKVTCMPVIRHPNFSDTTCDLDPRDFTLLVGNQKGGDLKRISLYDFLEDPTTYLSKPESWLGKHRSLLCERDEKVLVSAQACFLPVPKGNKATFNPVVFNYQSMSGDPAVLTVLATREGTSVTIIDNKRDAFETGAVWGQRLFHNADGQRASLTGERESDSQVQPAPQTGSGKVRKGQAESGMNCVLLIQVPLKQKHPMRSKTGIMPAPCAAMGACDEAMSKRSDVENAVIGHGDLEGPFTEIDNLAIERDERFPVRVTVQFYKATSNGGVNKADIKAISDQIGRIYAKADIVGSLVTEGRTGRITEYQGAKVQPADWWKTFWERHEQNTGDSREEAMEKLRELLGPNFTKRPVCELYLRSLLKS